MATTNIAKVTTAGFEAVLLAYLRDTDRRRPVWISYLGPKNAVKALTARAMSKDNQAAEGNHDTFAFFVEGVDAVGESVAFKLPDSEYKSFLQPIENPGSIQYLPRNRRPAMQEGRILSHAATMLAGDEEFYVPVYREIDIPRVNDAFGRNANDIWRLYLNYVQRPHSDEFKAYKPPLWAVDLYNLYMYLSARVRVPMHEYWMPYLFQNVAGRYIHGGYIMQYLKGYVSPEILAREEATGRPLVEHGAYRVMGTSAQTYWQNILAKNPNRYDGINFTPIDHKIEEVIEQKNADDITLDAGEGEIF